MNCFPVPLNTLLQAPAERFDVIIDFANEGGRNFVLTNNGPTPFPGGGEVVPGAIMRVYPGTVTQLIMKFDLPRGTTVIPGHRYKYVWHCHILEHEDNEMMRPMDVIG